MNKALAEKLINRVNEQLDDGDAVLVSELTQFCHESGFLAPDADELLVLINAIKKHRSKPAQVVQRSGKIKSWGGTDKLTWDNNPTVIHRNPVFVFDGERADPFALDPTNLAGYAFQADDQIRRGVSLKIYTESQKHNIPPLELNKIRVIMRWREIVWGDKTPLIQDPRLVLARLLPGLVPG